MGERPFFSLTFCVDQIPNGTTLHENDGMMSIFSHRSGRKTIDILGMDRLQDTFKGKGCNMMTRIYDDHSIFFREGFLN